MVELDDATRRALLARDGPPEAARAEVLAGLRGRLGGAPSPDDPGSDQADAGDLGGGTSASLDLGGSAGGQLVWAAKITGATLGLAAAGLLSLKVGIGVVRGGDGDRSSEAAVTVPVAGEPLEPALAVSSSTLAEPSTTRAEGEGEGEGDSKDRREPQAEGRARGEASRPSLAGSDSTLAAELELVRAAKRLAEPQPAAALVELDRHRERFEAGVLAPEREALRVELLCALGRRSEAAKVRASFLAQFPDSPLRARVRQECGGDGTEPGAAGDGSR